MHVKRFKESAPGQLVLLKTNCSLTCTMATALANTVTVNGHGAEKSGSKHKSKNQLRREKAKAKKTNNVKPVCVFLVSCEH